MKRTKIVYPVGAPFPPFILSAGGGGGTDDVLEYANLAAFPATGISGAIYLAADTGKSYRWNGTTYVLLVVTKSDVGLGNVDNTSDANKPISTAQAAVNAEYKPTIEFMSGVLTYTFYAPYPLVINSVTNVLNTPTTTITANGAAYTLGNTISQGHPIVVTVSTASVIRLNCTK